MDGRTVPVLDSNNDERGLDELDIHRTLKAKETVENIK